MLCFTCRLCYSPSICEIPSSSRVIPLIRSILMKHHTLPTSMASYVSFEDLEASVPLSQLQPSVAFSRCTARLPEEVDQLHGDELVQSLEAALVVHSKARVVLQCWVLLIMRRRVDARHEKDALYDRLQQTALSPQEKTRYRRGAMLLCHLLIERGEAEATSLLDRYLVDFYFPWSAAVNDRDDTFFLLANIIHWVRQALDHMELNGSKITAVKWLESPRLWSSSGATSSSSPPPKQSLEHIPHSQLLIPSNNSRHHDTRPMRASVVTEHWSPPQLTSHKKRRRTAAAQGTSASAAAAIAHRELRALKNTIEQWAKRLRRQLLHAAHTDDKEQIRQVADELQAPPLKGCKAIEEDEKQVTERVSDDDSAVDDDDKCREGSSSDVHEAYEGDSDDGQRRSCKPRAQRPSTTTDSDDSSDGPSCAGVHYCTVCAERPKRVEQVWNLSCRHGCCGGCMLAWLSQRKRQCMYCRTKILQVVDESGKVFHHYDWTKWWKRWSQAERGVEVVGLMQKAE